MTSRYESLMDVVRSRMTNRAFAPAEIPRAPVEMILGAARHAPSGANAQPWHFIVVTDEGAKAAIGQDDIQKQVKPLLSGPDELSIIDVMCFGPPLKPSYKRGKKWLDQIVSWDRFDPANAMTDAQINEWVKTTRHKVMYRDESRVD